MKEVGLGGSQVKQNAHGLGNMYATEYSKERMQKGCVDTMKMGGRAPGP